MATTPGIGGGKSIGYKELFNNDTEYTYTDPKDKTKTITVKGNLNDTISDRFQDVQDALAKVKAKPGDPAALMELQVAMNALQQVMSTTTQLINSLKTMTEGINRNI